MKQQTAKEATDGVDASTVAQRLAFALRYWAGRKCETPLLTAEYSPFYRRPRPPRDEILEWTLAQVI